MDDDDSSIDLEAEEECRSIDDEEEDVDEDETNVDDFEEEEDIDEEGSDSVNLDVEEEDIEVNASEDEDGYCSQLEDAKVLKVILCSRGVCNILLDPTQTGSGVLPRPCFPKILARTTFVLESLPEAKNPGQDAIFGEFCP